MGKFISSIACLRIKYKVGSVVGKLEKQIEIAL